MPAPPIWNRSFTLAVIATLVVFIGFYLLIPALPPYAEARGASKAEVGLVVGIYSIAAVAIRLLTGGAMDRHGRKRFLLAGLLLFSAAAASYGFAASLPWLVACRILHGLGWGWITTGFGSFAADLAPAERRGEAIGYWGVAPPLAMAIGPLAGAAILSRSGYFAVFAGTAALGIAGAALVLPIAEPPAHRREGERPRYSFLRTSLVPALTLFLSSLSYGAIIAFVPVQLQDRPGRAGMFFSVYAVTMLLVRPFAGRISDRFGRGAILHPGLVLTAAGVALLAWSSTPVVLLAAAVVYGLGISGSYLGLLALTVDATPPGARNAAMAGFFAAYDLAIALGALLLGPLYQRWGFATMILAAAGAVVASHLLFVTLGWLRLGAADKSGIQNSEGE